MWDKKKTLFTFTLFLHLYVWNMSYIMSLFPFPELEPFIQRLAVDSQIREGDWKSLFCQKFHITVQTQETPKKKKKITSKSGKKQEQKVHHKDAIFQLACLLKLVDLVQIKPTNSPEPFVTDTPSKCSLPKICAIMPKVCNYMQRMLIKKTNL